MGILKNIWYRVSGQAKRERLAKEAEWERKRQEHLQAVKDYGIDVVAFRIVSRDFEPSAGEYIYVASEDPEYDAYDEFVRSHLNELRAAFATKGCDFLYIKTLANELMSDDEVMAYHFPAGTGNTSLEPLIKPGNDFLLNLLMEKKNRKHVERPCFAVFSHSAWDTKKGVAYHAYNSARFDYTTVSDFEHFVYTLIEEIHRKGVSGPRYSLVLPKDADEAFSDDVEKLMTEVKERLTRLKAEGVSALVLHNLVDDTMTKVSRLAITADYRIFLADYRSIEVKMTPLVKAVFFLFLRHPEGIRFKELADYRDELAMIYDSIKSGKPLPEKIHPLREHDESIIALTDPLNNSINEKCARIKEAFITHVHDYIASRYYVYGKRGEAKRISLDRHNVIWNATLTDNEG